MTTELSRRLNEAGDSMPANMPIGLVPPEAINTREQDDGKILTIEDGIASWEKPNSLENISGLLDVDQGGTGINSYIKGDILYANATDNLARLPIGATGDILSVVGGVPAWTKTLSGSYTITSILIVSGNVVTPFTKSTTTYEFGANDATQWRVTTSGHLVSIVDNTYDIGASVATRPRTIYLAGTTSVVAAGDVILTATSGNIKSNTIDGADNKDIFIHAASGAIDSSRSAGIVISGNESTIAGGRLRLASGNTSNADILFETGGTNRWSISEGGHIRAIADNTVDIGASGINRPRTVYAATSVITGVVTALSTTSSIKGTFESTDNVALVDIKGAAGFSSGVQLYEGGVNKAATLWRASGGAGVVGLALNTGADRFIINATGHMLAGIDNTYDIGASGATRPRTIYVGTSVVTPLINTGAAVNLIIQRNSSDRVTVASETMVFGSATHSDVSGIDGFHFTSSTVIAELSLYSSWANAATEAPGKISFRGKDDAGAVVSYGNMEVVIVDSVAGAYDAKWFLRLASNGAVATRLAVEAGLQIGGPTGGDKGVGTLNLDSALYKDGTQVVSDRVTGYVAISGTANRGTSYDTSTITLEQLAQRVKAVQDDLTTHGLIGA